MAKLTKNKLKGIVKECLVELLSEGLAPQSEIVLERKVRPQQERRSAQNKKQSIFDQMDRSFAGRKPATDFESAVSNAARTATDDPVLREILADTAKTTLQEQLRHEPATMQQPGMPQPGALDLMDNNSSVEDSSGAGLDIHSLFGEVTNNWSEVLERSGAKKLP
jgi:hypothetical protein